MTAKDYVKSLTAEIVGLGIDQTALTVPATADADQPVSAITPYGMGPGPDSPAKENANDGSGLAEPEIADLLGRATVKVWGQLPRDAQEAISRAPLRHGRNGGQISPPFCTRSIRGRCIRRNPIHRFDGPGR